MSILQRLGELKALQLKKTNLSANLQHAQIVHVSVDRDFDLLQQTFYLYSTLDAHTVCYVLKFESDRTNRGLWRVRLQTNKKKKNIQKILGESGFAK